MFAWLFQDKVDLHIDRGKRGRWRWTARDPSTNKMRGMPRAGGWATADEAIRDGQRLFRVGQVVMLKEDE